MLRLTTYRLLVIPTGIATGKNRKRNPTMMSNEKRSAKDSCAMHVDYAKSKPGRHSRLKAFGMIAGAGAVLAAVSFTLAQPDNSVGGGSVPNGRSVLVAGGNHNPTPAPPTVPGMNMGGSVVETTPASVLPTEVAVPPIKAGH